MKWLKSKMESNNDNSDIMSMQLIQLLKGYKSFLEMATKVRIQKFITELTITSEDLFDPISQKASNFINRNIPSLIDQATEIWIQMLITSLTVLKLIWIKLILKTFMSSTNTFYLSLDTSFYSN